MSRSVRVLVALGGLLLGVVPLSQSSAAPNNGGAGPITQMIVKYKPGNAVVNADGSAVGDEQLDAGDRGLKLGNDIGFGYRVVKLARPVDEATAWGQAQRIRKSAAVAWAEPDLPVTAYGAGSQSNPPSWGLDRIDETTLPLDKLYAYGSSGAGVTAYIVDTGILATHTDFGSRVRSGYTAISDGRGTTDCAGHGTHVAGTVGGTTYGVAKDVQLVAVRVLDCTGSGTMSGVTAGINWAVNDHKAGTPAVLNMSLGGGFNTTVNDAVAAAVADGITVVVASGNSSTDACTSSPASAPAAITVNAADSNDVPASFTNYGSCTDIYAPGVSIRSDYYLSTTSTATMSGTSMASPHVAGAAARILEQNPGYSPAQVWSALQSAAISYSSGKLNDATRMLVLAAPVVASGPPSAPQNVTAQPANGSAVVSWTAPATTGGGIITGYTASAFTAASGGSAFSSCGPVATLTCTITGLANGTTYYVEVTADNGTFVSAPSARVAVTPAVPATVSDAPTAVTAVRGGSGEVSVGWAVPGNNGGSAIASFTARAFTASSGGSPARSCSVNGASATSCVITGLTGGTQYWIDVIATNGVGASAPSSPRVAITAQTVSSAPTNLKLSAGTRSVTASWSAPSNTGGSAIIDYTATAYSDQARTVPVGSCTVLATSRQCTISPLTSNVTVYVTVTARNAVGVSPQSSAASTRPR